MLPRSLFFGMLALGILGTPVLGWSLRRRATWGAALLWLAPMGLTLAAADAFATLVGTLAPRWDQHWGVFALGCVLAAPLAEVLVQWITTTMAGGGVERRRAGDPPAR